MIRDAGQRIGEPGLRIDAPVQGGAHRALTDESRAAHWVSRVVYVTAKLSLADYHAAAPISALSPRRARLTSYGGVPIIPPGLRKS